MQKLEKILEEIGELRGQVGSECTSEDHYTKKAWEHCLDRVVGIIRKHMNDSQCGECSRRRWYQIGYKDGKRMNDGWIPVEKRLPEEYGEYLVTIVTSAGYLWAKRIIANFSDLMGIVKKPIFYTGEVGKIDFEDITDMVIAWSPLPEPYRPERSSDEKE
ncbi:MAG: hypothetical protein KHX75_12925 [Lachnospiraceae bacterium]|nr:hypothetical protein [Lachnospiraceae bacterium]MBS5469721.1 hypothetical protein [Clostridium sp.]